ncbi:BZ3501_MvSof-1269-A2-R1_Chr10-2g02688 [Microbotryum saponariae]|nr:BZ3501_MvSof-1269-A2-R1_Chr10-2g02688 [Microbotryum saponariae]
MSPLACIPSPFALRAIVSSSRYTRSTCTCAVRPTVAPQPFHHRRTFIAAPLGARDSESAPASTSKLAPELPARSVSARRALLYVPGSNVKMLRSALSKATSDALILDLEDSVATGQKGAARQNVFDALQSADSTRSQLFVRINSPTRSFGLDDLQVVLKSSNLQGIVIPKVDTVKDVQVVDRCISEHGLEATKDRIKLVVSVESPLSLMNLKEIATCSNRIDALLFAAEDYCASSNIIRTESRQEMLFVRSQIVAVAKAFGLGAIDLVRTAYKGETATQALEEEATEARRLGFDGKQCIHPNQVETVQKCFTPSEKGGHPRENWAEEVGGLLLKRFTCGTDIERATRILEQYNVASLGGAGAYGLVGEDGNSAMIDAPMRREYWLKQRLLECFHDGWRRKLRLTLTATFAPKAVTDHSRCFLRSMLSWSTWTMRLPSRVPSTAQLTHPRPLTSRRCPRLKISSPPKALDVSAVANSCTRETEMEEHTEDFDDSLDAATAEIEEALLLKHCETTAAAISVILDAAEGNKASSLDDPQPQILMDPFHFFQRIYLSKKHGATRAFLRALSDAIYVVNLDDKHLVSIRLAKAMMTFDEATRSPAHAKYIWKLFETFGSLLDVKTKQPLFNKAALLAAKRCLELVRKGQLSDPVGIELYTDLGPCRGPDGTADDGVRLYSCRRGTNALEGGIHRNLRARFAKSIGKSPPPPPPPP